MGNHPLDAGFYDYEPITERRGPRRPSVVPLLPSPLPTNHLLAVIDIDSDEREDNKERGGAMLYNTTRRMKLAIGAASVEDGAYRELPGADRFRQPADRGEWDRFFDPGLLSWDVQNPGAADRVAALEAAGWRIIFVTSLPENCFETRRAMLTEAGLLPVSGITRGLICKPRIAQYMRTDHWKALVTGGVQFHHYLDLTEKEYRLLPDLMLFFPWMNEGLTGLYQPSHVLFLDDEEKNLTQIRKIAQAIEIEWGQGRVQVSSGTALHMGESYCR